MCAHTPFQKPWSHLAVCPYPSLRAVEPSGGNSSQGGNIAESFSSPRPRSPLGPFCADVGLGLWWDWTLAGSVPSTTDQPARGRPIRTGRPLSITPTTNID